MKKTLLLSLLALPVAALAQHNVSEEPTLRGILLEDFTGIHCGHCPEGHAVLAAMEAFHPQINIIAVHAGSYSVPRSDEPEFRTEDGNFVHDFFEVYSYPSGVVDRHNFGDGYVTGRSSWTDEAKVEMGKYAEVNLWAKAVYDGNAKTLKVDLEGYYMNEEPTNTYNINVALVQSRVLGPQNGACMGSEYVHNHMLRKYITPVQGDAVTVSAADKYFERSYTAEMPAEISEVELNPLNVDVVVFVTKDMTEVVNATTVHPTYTNCKQSGVFELTDYNIPYDLQPFAGDTMTFCATNLTPNAAETLTIEVKAAGSSDTYDIQLDEPLQPGAHRLISVKLPEMLGDADANVAAKIIKVNGNDVTCEPLELQVEDVPHCSTYGKVVMRADQDEDDNTWTLCDIDGNVIYDFGVVPYTGNEVSYDVTLEDGKCYYIQVTDEWGNGVQNPRGIVKYTNSEGAMQVQNLSIAGFGTRLYFMADSSRNPSAGIDDIDTDDNATPEYYTISGIRIAQPTHDSGVVIERRGAKVSKIVK